MLVYLCMTSFLHTKEILKNVVNQAVLVIIDFSQNYFFYIQKGKSHAGLEPHEGQYFLSNLSLYVYMLVGVI